MSIPGNPPPHAAAAPRLDPATLLFELQILLDRVLTAPRWVGWALLALALVLLVLHNHGQRVLAAVLLGGGAVLIAFALVRPSAASGSLLPGLLAIGGGGAGALFGLLVPGWATAVICAVALGAVGWFAAILLGALAIGGALPLGGLGLLLGIVNRRSLSVAMPALGAALAATLGAARMLAPNSAGAHVVALSEIAWASAAFALLAVIFLAVAFEREHLVRRRREAKKTRTEDDAAQKRIAGQKEKFAKYLDS